MDANITLNYDWPARYLQFQEMAAHDNGEAEKVYHGAMRDWRLNAYRNRELGLPDPQRPSPAMAYAAYWPDTSKPPQLMITDNWVCQPEPDNVPPIPKPPVIDPLAPAGAEIVVLVGAPAGRGVPIYNVLPGDTAPDGFTLRKRVKVGIGGKQEWYEAI